MRRELDKVELSYRRFRRQRLCILLRDPRDPPPSGFRNEYLIL